MPEKIQRQLHRIRIKGHTKGSKSTASSIEFVKKEYPQFDEIEECETVEEAVKDADIISFTTTVKTDMSSFPVIDGKWIKPGALISMPSAARFIDDDFLVNKCRFVVDNRKLYEAWSEEYDYPTYNTIGIVGCKFTDLIHEGRCTWDDITDIADIITGKKPGRKSDDEIIIYSVGGMPVEDVAWGCTVYRRALKEGIGTKLNLWEKPEMA